MRAAHLDKLITLMRREITLSDIGEEIVDWIVIDSRRPAGLMPLGGDERASGPQTVATERVAFRIRRSANVAELSPLDRLIYPALVASSPAEVIADRATYDIVHVEDLGRYDLKITATRRTDTVPTTP